MSPVRELTERPTIPRLGKIRLGEKDPTRGFPIARPYFVCPPEVQAVYGAEPTELRVVFLSDDLERIASQYYRAYNATNGLICKGDGYFADALLDADELAKRGGDLSQPLTLDIWAHGATPGRGSATKTVVRTKIDCPGSGYEGAPPCPYFVAKKCAVRTFLQFAIRDVPGLGVYQLDTGSVISTRKINGAIELSRQVVGGVAGIPMILRRVQQEVAPDGIKKKVWMVELEVDTQYSLANLLELRAGPVAAALLPPVDESEVYDHIDADDGEALEHQHDPAFTADGAKVCRSCDVVLELPPRQEPSAPVRGPAAADYGTAVRAIIAVYKDVKESQGEDRAATLDAAIIETFPETKDLRTGKCFPNRVSPEHAADLLASLRRAQGGPPAGAGGARVPERDTPAEEGNAPAQTTQAAEPAPDETSTRMTDADAEFEALSRSRQEHREATGTGQATLINPPGGPYL